MTTVSAVVAEQQEWSAAGAALEKRIKSLGFPVDPGSAHRRMYVIYLFLGDISFVAQGANTYEGCRVVAKPDRALARTRPMRAICEALLKYANAPGDYVVPDGIDRLIARHTKAKTRLGQLRESARRKQLVISRQKVAETVARRTLGKWPDNKLRRCSIKWEERVPAGVARSQEIYERGATAVAMRQAGLTLTEVGQRFGVGPERARQIIATHERGLKRRDNRSPVERHFANDAISGCRDFAGMRFEVGGIQKRDWLQVGTTMPVSDLGAYTWHDVDLGRAR